MTEKQLQRQRLGYGRIDKLSHKRKTDSCLIRCLTLMIIVSRVVAQYNSVVKHGNVENQRLQSTCLGRPA